MCCRILTSVVVTLCWIKFGVAEVEKRAHGSPAWIDHCWDQAGTHLLDPFCVTVFECNHAPEISNGGPVHPYNKTVNSNVTYTCNQGYERVGPEVITCQRLENKTLAWSKPPTCLTACAPVPQVPFATFEHPASRLVGVVVNYSCVDWYMFETDVTSIQCLAGGSWSMLPVCTLGPCTEAPSIEHGSTDADNSTIAVGASVTLTCDEGYHVVGNASIVCLGNNTWREPLPRCMPPACPRAPRIDNGFVVGPSVILPTTTTAPVNCEENSSAPGCNHGSTVNTSGNGAIHFSGVNGTVDLGGNFTEMIGNFSGNVSVGQIGNYTFPVIDMDDEDNRTDVMPNMTEPTTANVISTTTGVFTTSTDVFTTTPEPINSPYVHYEVGTVLQYACNKGYSMQTTDHIQCLRVDNTSYWSELPLCVIDCGVPTSIANGSVQYNATTLGEYAYYSCDDNFNMTDAEYNVSTCQFNSTWTQAPGCMPYCGDSPSIDHATVTRVINVTDTALYQVTCYVSFRLIGDEYFWCDGGMAKPEWTALPRCECNRRPVDIVFIVDGSGSVEIDGFNRTLQFVNDLISRFPEDTTRFGLLVYSTFVKAEFYLNEYINDRQGMFDRVKTSSYPAGSTATSDALQFAREHMFQVQNGMRPNVPQAAIVITDGQSDNVNRTEEQAQLLRDSGVTVYSVGVGPSVNQNELESLASNVTYVFNVNNYKSIMEVAGPLAHAACNDVQEPGPEDEHELFIL